MQGITRSTVQTGKLLPFTLFVTLIFLFAPSGLAQTRGKSHSKRSNTGQTSNPKAANDKNFAKAISAHLLLLEGSGAFYIGYKGYPISEAYDIHAKALAQLGFLRITGHEPTMVVTWDVYDLTPKGLAFFTPGKGFCNGKPELIRIINFTEPASTGPYVMSRVKYLYRLVDAPSWVSEWNKQNVDKQIPMPSNQFQDTQTFVLTRNGWVHESLVN